MLKRRNERYGSNLGRRTIEQLNHERKQKEEEQYFPCTVTPTLIPLYNFKPLDKLLFLAFFFLSFSLLLFPLVVVVCDSRCIKIVFFLILF